MYSKLTNTPIAPRWHIVVWSIMRTVFNLVYRENLLAPRCFYICTEYYKYICNPLVIYYYYNIKKEVE